MQAQEINNVNNLLNSLRFTEAEKQQMLQMDAKDYVITMFGLTVEQYHQMQYNAAHNYLIYYTHNNDDLVQQFMRCKSFWAWWKNGYANRDVEFMMWDCTQTHSACWYNKYLEVQDSRSLSQTIYPGKAVWVEMKSIKGGAK